MGKRRHVGANALVALTTLLLLVVSAGAGTLLLREVRLATARVVTASIASVQELIDAGVAWDRISPSILAGLTIHGASISTPENDAAVSANRVVVDISIANIVLGRSDARFSRFEFISPSIYVEDARGAAEFARILGIIQSMRVPQRHLELRFSGGTISAQTDEYSVAAARVNGTVVIDGDTIAATVAGRVSGSDADRRIRAVTRLDAELEGIRNLESFSGLLRLADVETSLGDVSEQVWRLDRSADGWNARKVEDELPLDLRASWPTGGDIDIEVRAQEFLLADFFDPAPNAPQSINRLFAQRASADMTVSVAPQGTITGADGWITTTINDNALPGALPADVAFSYDGRAWSIPRARVWGRRGLATFVGAGDIPNRAISGTVTFDEFAYGALPAVTGDAVINSDGGTYAITVPLLSIGASVVYDLSARISEGDFYDASLSFALDEEGISSVEVDGRIGDRDNAYATLDLSDAPTREIAALAAEFGYEISANIPWEDFDTLDLRSVIDLREGFFEADIARAVLRNRYAPEPFVAVSARITPTLVNIDSFSARINGYRASGNGLLHVASRGTMTINTAFEIEGIPYSLRAVYDPNDSLLVFGDYGFTARLLWQPRGGVRLSGSLEETPIPGSFASVSAAFSGQFTDRSNWFLTFVDVDVSDIPLPGTDQRGQARLYLSINPDTVSIAIVELEDRFSTLSGTAEIAYRVQPDVSANATIRLSSLQGIERYLATIRYDGGSWAVDASSAGFPLRRVPGRFTRGRLNGRLFASGPPGSIRARANFETEAAIWGDQDVSLAGNVEWTPTSIAVRQLSLGLGAQVVRVTAADIDASGTGTLSGRYLRPERAIDVPFTLAAQSESVPRLSREHLLQLPVTAEFQILGDEPFVFGIQRNDERTTVRRSDDGIQATVLDDGSFTMRLAQPASLRGEIDGQFRDGMIDATASNLEMDLDRLVAPSEEVVIEDGAVRGQLRMVGPVSDPEYFGVFSISGAQARIASLPQGIGPFDASIVVEERVARIRETTVPSGQAMALVSGNVLLQGMSVEAYEVHVQTTDDEGIHLVRQFGSVDVDGYARGSLTIGGTPVSTSVSGDIAVYRTQFAVGEQTERVNRRERTTTVDLSMKSGRAVQFIWPNDDFPILRTNFATGQQLDLALDSAAGSFSLTGDVQIQSGDIFYFDRNFLVREGVIQFQENETRFDPRLAVRAEIREASTDGPVRIYLIADGERLSNFAPRFESLPALPSADIVAILGGSIFQESQDSTVTVSTALLSSSDIVTQFGVFRQFEESVRRQLDLDLFAVRTSALQNILLTAITPTEEDAVPLTPSVGNYLNNTSVFMGRYIGDEVFGQFLVQMTARDFEQPTIEESPGVQRLGGVLIDSEFSLEWQTPFFLLEWTFAPREPEELFIRDNTFTFSWRFSY